jgi:hypothetical protein
LTKAAIFIQLNSSIKKLTAKRSSRRPSIGHFKDRGIRAIESLQTYFLNTFTPSSYTAEKTQKQRDMRKPRVAGDM